MFVNAIKEIKHDCFLRLHLLRLNFLMNITMHAEVQKIETRCQFSQDIRNI